MSDASRELGRMQQWMQAVIMHPGGVEEGLASAEAQHHMAVTPDTLEDVVTRSKALPATARLAIYNHAYYGRLQECLRVEFSALRHALGEELFNLFTMDYLQRYPSHSYTLGQLGAHFPQHLEETRPDRDAPPGERERWPDFIIDLARFERAFFEVFDGPGVEGQSLVTAAALQAGAAEAWPRLAFEPVGCLHLHRFHFPVVDYFTAVRQQQAPALPPPADTFVAVNRRDYVVRLHPLTRPQYEVLRVLAAGDTVADALDRAAEATSQTREVLAPLLPAWLGRWIDDGFFVRIAGSAC